MDSSANLNNIAEKNMGDWEDEWQAGIHPFHLKDVHSSLSKFYHNLLNGKEKIKVFIPLCGKTIDMKWLYDEGHTVVGVEFSPKAIIDFFKENALEYNITENVGSFKVYKSEDGRIKIYCGNIYDYTSSLEGQFDAIWDRGSFTAIELADREKYGLCLTELLMPDGIYLMQCPYYDSSVMSGPPRSVSEDHVAKCFGTICHVEKVDECDALSERWKNMGHHFFINKVYLMKLRKTISK